MSPPLTTREQERRPDGTLVTLAPLARSYLQLQQELARALADGKSVPNGAAFLDELIRGRERLRAHIALTVQQIERARAEITQRDRQAENLERQKAELEQEAHRLQSLLRERKTWLVQQEEALRLRKMALQKAAARLERGTGQVEAECEERKASLERLRERVLRCLELRQAANTAQIAEKLAHLRRLRDLILQKSDTLLRSPAYRRNLTVRASLQKWLELDRDDQLSLTEEARSRLAEIRSALETAEGIRASSDADARSALAEACGRAAALDWHEGVLAGIELWTTMSASRQKKAFVHEEEQLERYRAADRAAAEMEGEYWGRIAYGAWLDGEIQGRRLFLALSPRELRAP